jgi:hypothetical protein
MSFDEDLDSIIEVLTQYRTSLNLETSPLWTKEALEHRAKYLETIVSKKLFNRNNFNYILEALERVHHNVATYALVDEYLELYCSEETNTLQS